MLADDCAVLATMLNGVSSEPEELSPPPPNEKKWSLGHSNAILKNVKDGKSDKEIASILGRTVGSLKYKKNLMAIEYIKEGRHTDHIAKLLNIHPDEFAPKVWTQNDHELLLQYLERGDTDDLIADKLKRRPANVNKMRHAIAYKMMRLEMKFDFIIAKTGLTSEQLTLKYENNSKPKLELSNDVTMEDIQTQPDISLDLGSTDSFPTSDLAPDVPIANPDPPLYAAVHFKWQGNTFDDHIPDIKLFDNQKEALDYRTNYLKHAEVGEEIAIKEIFKKNIMF